MELQVKLEVFDGPLDLLLHLIEKNKVDIFDSLRSNILIMSEKWTPKIWMS